MSAIELYLKQARSKRGTWHKIVISNLREYMKQQKEEDIISAINQITDVELLSYLWEVGLSETLQDVANKRSVKLAGTFEQEVT